MEQKTSYGVFFWMGLVLGLCLIIAAGIGSYTFYTVKSFDNALTVTGSAKKDVTSDVVKWRSTFTRNVTLDSLKSGYATMKNDQALVVKFFKDNNIPDSAVDISPVTMNQISWDKSQGPIEFSLVQNVVVQSSDVQKITDLSKNIDPIIESGVIFASQSLEYYYSKLPEDRVSLLGDAIKDAQNRAAMIAGSSGKSVGTLKSADAGVVQLLPTNSVEISDYGNYDTSTIQKELMITVHATFILK